MRGLTPGRTCGPATPSQLSQRGKRVNSFAPLLQSPDAGFPGFSSFRTRKERGELGGLGERTRVNPQPAPAPQNPGPHCAPRAGETPAAGCAAPSTVKALHSALLSFPLERGPPKAVLARDSVSCLPPRRSPGVPHGLCHLHPPAGPRPQTSIL